MNENTKLLLNNLVAVAGLLALAFLAYTGKAPVEAFIAYLGGLVVRPGLPTAGSNPQ